MTILVIDAQGGGIGKQLIQGILRDSPAAELVAVGTNSAATMTMLKAGAKRVATGENAVVVACRQADIIVGPLGIAIADSMNGEVTPQMALAVAQSRAERVLIPFNHCGHTIIGVKDFTTSVLIQEALQKVQELSQ